MTQRRPSGPSVERIPAGDTRTRLVCPDCGFIDYKNPKIVVGAVCIWEDRVLLARRAIEPRRGLWTIPAGFLEADESSAEGAVRETREEACAEIRIESLLGVYEIPWISQVQMLYRAAMLSPDHAAGEESLETMLVGWDAIPWDDLAFPSVGWALRHARSPGGPWTHTATRDR